MNEPLTVMLEESLEELLEASKYCVEYSKSSPQWDDYRKGGCLGFPSGILLFSIIDSIGSYFRKNKDFEVMVDGKSTIINHSGWEHFKILNSKYFNQDLSADFLKTLYHHYRSSLTHNAVLGGQVMMYPSSEATIFKNLPFTMFEIEAGRWEPIVFMKELYLLCRSAVDLFKLEIDEIVPNSNQVQVMNLKK